MKVIKLCLISLLIIVLSNCSPLGPQYRNIQQGNLIDDEDLEQLSIGMDKEQVTDILGSPLLNDTFDPDRWEYVYSREVKGRIITQYHIIIEFQNNRIVNIEENVPEGIELL